MFLINGAEPIFSLKLAFWYALAQLKFIHPILPQKLRDKLPTGWNFHMFWTAFKSGGTKAFIEYYCKFKEPNSYKPKVSVAPEFQLSEKDIQFFYDNCYLGPFDLISTEEAEEMRDYLVNSVFNVPPKTLKYEFQEDNGLADELFPEHENSRKLTEEQKQKILAQMGRTNRHLEDSQLLNLFQRPEIVERCAQLLGEDLILWRSDCFEVPPHAKGTPWHQASTWFFHNFREPAAVPLDEEDLFQVTCWIALTDANKEKGCVALFPGSHKEIYPVKVDRKVNDTNAKHRYIIGELDYPVEEKSPQLIEVKAGQFFLFCERAVHGSIPNQTDSSRWGINCRIAKTSTSFFTNKRMFEEGHQIAYYKLRDVSLDKWKAVLVRGSDRFGYNPLLEK